MWWLARVRLVLARRPWLYWTLAGWLAAMAGLQVWSVSDDAVRARHVWGTTRAVWVVTSDAHPGDPVAVARRDYPVAVLPSTALGSPPSAPVAARPLAAGTVLAIGDLADAGTVPADWVIVAVAAEHAPTLTPGDQVALFAAGQSLCDGIAAATGASPDVAQVEVGVPLACAAQLSIHLAAADVVLTRRAAGASRRT